MSPVLVLAFASIGQAGVVAAGLQGTESTWPGSPGRGLWGPPHGLRSSPGAPPAATPAPAIPGRLPGRGAGGGEWGRKAQEGLGRETTPQVWRRHSGELGTSICPRIAHGLGQEKETSPGKTQQNFTSWDVVFPEKGKGAHQPAAMYLVICDL